MTNLNNTTNDLATVSETNSTELQSTTTKETTMTNSLVNATSLEENDINVLLKNIDVMEFHPLAGIFPMMKPDEMKDLKEDIRLNGQGVAIVTYQGKILDGRNRYMALIDLGLSVKTEEYTGSNALDYVVSLNMVRRHMDESQRSMAAVKIATYKHGGNQYSNGDAPIEAFTSQADAAGIFQVSRTAVQRAAKVVNKGIPELAQAVTDGKISVSAAVGIAALEHEKQSEIMSHENKKEILKAFKAIGVQEEQKIEQEKIDVLKAVAVKQIKTHPKDCTCGQCPEQKRVTLLISFTETEAFLIDEAIKKQDVTKDRALFVHGIVTDFCNTQAQDFLTIPDVVVENNTVN